MVHIDRSVISGTLKPSRANSARRNPRSNSTLCPTTNRPASNSPNCRATSPNSGAASTSAVRIPWMCCGPMSRWGFSNVTHSCSTCPRASSSTTAISMTRCRWLGSRPVVSVSMTAYIPGLLPLDDRLEQAHHTPPTVFVTSTVSGRDVDRDLLAQPGVVGQLELVAAPETARVVPARPAAVEQAHLLVGDGDHLGAVRRLELEVAHAAADRRDPTAHPSRSEPRSGRERRAVEPRDSPQYGVLHRASDLVVELAQPHALTVLARPHEHCVAQVMQLHAAMMRARPHVRQRTPELRVPHQRRQILDDDRHPDVVDRAVRRQLDGAIGRTLPAEKPNVTCSCQFRSVIL